jgi:AGZA family xanthine/uracil permease-like MFS transporter
MRLFVRGDLDGFFGLALDNLVQLLLIDSLCRHVLEFPDELLYGRVLPGVAVSLLVGNLFYAWQAHRLAARTGRSDVTALPYGINTPSVFAFVFLVMLPVKLDALKNGLDPAAAAEAAWRMGLIACVGSGLIEFLGAFVAEPIRRMTPRAALLSTLAGIAVGFISGGFLFRTFAHPIVGLSTLGVVLLVYFGGVRFKGGLPGGLVAVSLGTVLSWATGLVTGDWPSQAPQFHPPIAALGDIFEPLRGAEWLNYLTVIVPMGLINLLGSLQNIESAEAAGDAYPTMPSLAMNGVSTLAAAAFGSCFPTTIYIGHPGWKALGARAG